jgi:predicted AAA+ superfamily ATPase
LKLCDYWQDVHGHKAELRYIRDEKGKEVDFVVLRDRKPLFAVECKLSDTDAAPALLEFKARLDIPKWYQVHMGTKTRIIDSNYKILPFEDFCEEAQLI